MEQQNFSHSLYERMPAMHVVIFSRLVLAGVWKLTSHFSICNQPLSPRQGYQISFMELHYSKFNFLTCPFCFSAVRTVITADEQQRSCLASLLIGWLKFFFSQYNFQSNSGYFLQIYYCNFWNCHCIVMVVWLITELCGFRNDPAVQLRL